MRRRMSRRGSRRLFKRTALKVHKRNLGKALYRGGFRF